MDDADIAILARMLAKAERMREHYRGMVDELEQENAELRAQIAKPTLAEQVARLNTGKPLVAGGV